MSNTLENMIAAFLGISTVFLMVFGFYLSDTITHPKKYIVIREIVSPSVAYDANGNPQVVTEN